jgi:hypothetical protein
MRIRDVEDHNGVRRVPHRVDRHAREGDRRGHRDGHLARREGDRPARREGRP